MFKLLFNLFYPRLCNGCKELLLQEENVICTHCRHHLPFTYQHTNTHNELTTKFFGLLPIEFACSMLFFHKEGIVQEMIHNLKYRKQQNIGSVLGTIYGNELKQSGKFATVDYIIPTPIHKKRLKQRGYNQVITFCEAISKELNVPIEEEAFFRVKHALSQTKKTKEKREKINASDFEAQYQEKHIGKHFLLIDDVITTGATIEACAKALLQIPEAKISIVSIAYTI